MENEIEDFWPDLGVAAIETPASILKTQASALGRKTGGSLQGAVESWSRNDEIHHTFFVTVPSLEDYRFALLSVHHGPAIYPVVVDNTPVSAKGPHFDNPRRSLTQPDEQVFKEWLKATLAAPETKNIMEGLLALARS